MRNLNQTNTRIISQLAIIFSYDRADFERSKTEQNWSRLLAAYLNPWEMPEHGERDRDGGVHVRAGDVAGRVDHHRHDQPTGERLPELRYALLVAGADPRRPARHEHQQESGHHLRHHLFPGAASPISKPYNRNNQTIG
jgi:hypothetical protein